MRVLEKLKQLDGAADWRGVAAQERAARAVAAAVRTSMPSIASIVFSTLGNAYDSLGDFSKAIEYHAQHLEIAKEVGDRGGEGKAYANLGCAYQAQGGFRKAIEYQTQCLAIAKEVGDRAGKGRAYRNLGNAYLSLGGYAKAIEYHTQSLAIAKEVGDRAGEGMAYANLGCAYFSQGDFSKAIKYHTQDLAIAKEVGNRAGEGGAYGNLGSAYEKQGEGKGGGGPGFGGHGVREPWHWPHALERARQSRRLLRSTTCPGNIAEACTRAVRRSAQNGCRPHPSRPGSSPEPCYGR